MFLTGFADEAGGDFAVQIKATRELGWRFIESRAIGSGTLGTISESEFDEVCRMLDESGIRINCYGSAVANWSRDVRSPEDHETNLRELRTAIPRMKKLGIGMLRGMSFRIVKDTPRPDLPELEKEIFAKVQQYVDICAENGIIYGHENCMNYGGLSWRHTLKLLDNIRGDNFRLIFDTGNPVLNYACDGDEPFALQSPWEFYANVREFVAYVHIKDAVALPREAWREGVREQAYTWPGEGCGDVRAIVIDLLKNGYDGGFSMEPHVATVFHEKESADSRASIKYQSYVEYGRRFMKLLEDCSETVKAQQHD